MAFFARRRRPVPGLLDSVEYVRDAAQRALDRNAEPGYATERMRRALRGSLCALVALGEDRASVQREVQRAFERGGW
jgi:hypothetical protein